MRDKAYGGILIAVVMGACCIGLPLLVVAISSGALVAWLSDNAVIGFLVMFGGIIAFLMVRQSKRRAREIGNRSSHDKTRVDDAL